MKVGNLGSSGKARRLVGTKACASIILVVMAGGCAQLGPDLVKAGRNDYNQVLSQTEDEETLLNLVRLRYGDNPVVMDVSSVSTSFTWNQGLEASAFKFEPDGTGTNAGVKGSLDYTERPTITYTPLSGKEFVTNVLERMDITALILLSQSGWSIERLFRITVNRMNGAGNAVSAAGPTPNLAPDYERFREAARLLRGLQARDALSLGYREVDEGRQAAIAVDPSIVTAEDLSEIERLLGLDSKAKVWSLDESRSRNRNADHLGLELRSLSSIMFFLAHGVQVPEGDIAVGRVTTTRRADGSVFDWSEVVGDLLTIRSSPEPVANAAASVKYRGHWFYIDDADMSSKYTFMLLGQLTALQAGKIERSGPLLTLPLGP